MGYSADMFRLAEMHRRKKHFRNLAFMCHNTENNSSERGAVTSWGIGKPWVTWRPHGTKFDEYVEQVYNHKYVICPPGNGPDTHRIWEALYLGSIPVVKRGVMTEHFSQFVPMVLVDDWSALTSTILEDSWADLSNRKWGRMEYLTVAYWRKRWDDDRIRLYDDKEE
jgi:hypothetical protein